MSGYLPEEVVGVDAFTYMHQEDAKWAQVALQYSEYPCFSYTLRSARQERCISSASTRRIRLL